jgi:transposase-like protein
MKPKEFKDLLERLSTLTAKQRASMLKALEAPVRNESLAVHEIEARMGNDPVCPHCGSHCIGKWGIAKGLRRFRCKECKRTFNALTGTPLAHLRMKERWGQFAECLQESKTVRGSAEECGVHRNTTFRWRHRFLAWINENKPLSLHGVVEADETFFLESQKGSRHLNRKPRKRGGRASKRGRSKEQICVLVARDRSGQTTDHILPAFNAEVVDELLGPAIDPDAMLCTDGANVYATFADKRGLLHEAVNLSAGERIRAKTIHLQNVNGYHSRLKGWIARFHGVSTRWLPNYLGWRRMLDGHDQVLSPAVVLMSALKIINFNALR